MQRKNSLFKGCVLVLATQLLPSSKTSAQLSPEVQKVRVEKLLPWQKPYYAWTLKTWQKNDVPYLRLRNQIDLLAAQDRLREQLSRYEAEALRAPQDPKLQFRWAYAAWIAKKWLPTNDAQRISLYRPQRAVLNAPFPETLQYARLLFLLGTFRVSVLPGLLQLPGSKLYAQNPQDLEVKYFYGRALGGTSGKPSSLKKAVQILGELQRTDPKDLRYLWAQADAYDTAWMFNKRNKYAGDKAVETYRQYMKAAKLSAQDRKGYENHIAYIRSEQKSWAEWDQRHPRGSPKR